jgi:hypothetical protein
VPLLLLGFLWSPLAIRDLLIAVAK